MISRPIYQFGLEGESVDPEESKQWHERAIDNGGAKSASELALMYLTGVFGEPDYKNGERYLITSVDLGHKDAVFNLAMLYGHKESKLHDHQKALIWFMAASELGVGDTILSNNMIRYLPQFISEVEVNNAKESADEIIHKLQQ